MNELSKRLKELMNVRNLTAYDVQNNTGVSQATLSRLMSGKTKKPMIKNITRLANYFHVSSDWLLSGFEQPKTEGTELVPKNTETVFNAGENPITIQAPDVYNDKAIMQLQKMYNELKEVNDKLLNQNTLLIESNKLNAQVLLNQAENSKLLVNANYEQSLILRMQVETDRQRQETNVDRENSNV